MDHAPCFTITGVQNGFTVQHIYDGDTCMVGPFSVFPDGLCPPELAVDLYNDICTYGLGGDLLWNLVGNNTDVYVDWGDGTSEILPYGQPFFHQYPTDGIFTACFTYMTNGEAMITCCYRFVIPPIECCPTADFTFQQKETSRSCVNPEYYIQADCQLLGANQHTWIFENGDTLVNSGILTFDDLIFTDWVNLDGNVCVTHIVVCCGDTLSVTRCLPHPPGAYLGLPDEERRLSDLIPNPVWGPRVVDFIKQWSHDLNVPLLIDGRLILDLDDFFVGGWWNMGDESEIFNEASLFVLNGTTLQSAGRIGKLCCKWFGVNNFGYTRTTWVDATVSDAYYALHYPSLTSIDPPRLTMRNSHLLVNYYGIKSVHQPIHVHQFHGNEIIGADHDLVFCDCDAVNAIDFRDVSTAHTITFPDSGPSNLIKDYEQGFHFDNANLDVQNFDVFELQQYNPIPSVPNNPSANDAGIGIDFFMDHGTVGRLAMDHMNFVALSDELGASSMAVRALNTNGHFNLAASPQTPGNIAVLNTQNGYRIDLENGSTMNGGIRHNDLSTGESAIAVVVRASANNTLTIRDNEIVNNGGNTVNAQAISLVSFPENVQDFNIRHNHIVAQNAPGGAAIHLLRVRGAEVENNTIDNGASTVDGILIRQGGSHQVACNQVVDYQNGVAAEQSTGNTYSANHMQFNRWSMRFSGNNDNMLGTNTEWNTFEAANFEEVLFATTDCVTGAQDHTRYNSWLGQNGVEARHADSNPTGNAPFCRFNHPPAVPVGSIHRPAVDPNQLMWPNGPISALPSGYCANPGGPTGGGGGELTNPGAEGMYLALLTDTTLTAGYTAAQMADLNRVIWTLLQANPSWVSAHPEFAAFQSTQTGGFAAEMADYQAALAQYTADLTAQQAAMAADQTILDSLQTLIQQLYEQAASEPDSATAAGILAQAGIVVTQAETVAGILAAQSAANALVNQASLAVLASDLAAISTTAPHEVWTLAVETILLDVITGQPLSPTQAQSLRSIAQICMDDGSSAVVLARGACLAMLGEVYDDTGCIPAFQGGGSTSRVATALTVSPNPANGQVLVSWNPDRVSDLVTLEVADMTGRMVFRQAKLDGQSGMISLSTANWPVGTVVVRLIHDTGMEVMPLQIAR
ncbi:MAG: hypothetical protein H6568_13360 [Lewinellaceae bacterium]|nr:hypothetical protein [Lewinellaceae bacterium]